MKKLLFLFLTIAPFCLKAQTTSTQSMGDVAYVLNEKKVTKAEFDAVPPSDVLEAGALKGDEATKAYGPGAANGVFVMVTRKFAIASYQEKLSQLCDSYESYLTGHGTEDDAIAYDLDGKTLPKNPSGMLTLYHLPKDKIADAVFTEKEPETSKFAVRIVITTKK